MAMATVVIKVPDEQQGALIFNALVCELRFDPSMWGSEFDEWSKSDYQAPASISLKRGYDLEERYVEVRSQEGITTKIPLEITRAARVPEGYNALTEPTRATPAIMPRKKPRQ